ncbi:MAG: bacteriohopanetetrol glucosamine biosynthesis glycosyltransferase HpnI [Acidobacteriales bacterium]|nr:bacteriohopanetetrol glucosamine biosynthesis glycosyltransferase HpnI [Candidatus Koribacter versatilis]MBI3644977.1 bacteriohopanetetrol glucosamine biosynthesis glycosyltransferase HpnI [Terriglobales bacterium]
MHLSARALFEAVAALGTLCSLGFYLLSGCGIASFLRERRRQRGLSGLSGLVERQLPPVSILKPLKGIDPQIWEAFCTHCEQDYPDYQLVFGVSDPEDPAIGLVRKLQEKYPDRQIDLLVCQRDLGTNRKLSTLAQMLPEARHEVLLVNDSDIRVAPDYLRRVIAPLADAAVGMVTCLYRGVASGTLGSRLEALGISTDFVPGVLSARLIEKGLHFGLGSTLAFRRADLQAIGGFEAMVDYLADDYELGNRIAALGKRVELSDVVVDTFLPAYSPRQFFDHQLRWARSVRGARSWGYVGLLLTFGIPWALATLLVARGAAWAWVMFAVMAAARLAVGLTSALAVLNDEQALRDIFLLPVRDLIAPIVWAIGLAGNRIFWRGDVFYLKDGRLTRVHDDAAGQQELSRS